MDKNAIDKEGTRKSASDLPVLYPSVYLLVHSGGNKSWTWGQGIADVLPRCGEMSWNLVCLKFGIWSSN